MMNFYFGLNVNKNLTDISNNEESLKNLNLNVKDLAIIKGLTDPGGVTRSDIKSLSGLNVDLEKTIVAISNETNTYSSLTTSLFDENSYVNSNLNVNGQLAAAGIKYNYLDSTNALKIADISTSRVSSWSTFESPATTSSPVFYGSEVRVEGPIQLSELVLRKPVIARRFESEIPTHKIKLNVDGNDVYVYAMKGIPLTFRGFFKNATVYARIAQTAGLRPSWTVKNVSTPIEYVYKNQLTGSTSQIYFFDSVARERDISFYYPGNQITELYLNGILLSNLPNAVLNSLVTLNVGNNELREMPNFSQFSSLRVLDISNNNLMRSANSLLNTLSPTVRNNLPGTLTSLTMGNCFSGAATANLANLPLINLNIDSSSRASRRLSGVSPDVNPNTIETYNISWNLFSNIPEGVKSSQTLKNLIISYNGISASDIRIDSNILETFQSLDNRHNLVDVSGKTKLVSYSFTGLNTPLPGSSIVTNIFTGCSALTAINLDSTLVTGAMPAFIGCNSLRSVTFRSTAVTDAETGFAIGENTFAACRETLNTLVISSNRFTINGQLHPNCFKLMPNLSYIEILSSKSGLSGPLPDFSTTRRLTTLTLPNNNLNGQIPDFTNNASINFVNLSNNAFTGVVPNIPHASLTQLLLTSNNITNFDTISSSGLLRLHLGFNRINFIPDLSQLTRLQEFFINNQTYTGSFFYTPGAFIGLTNIRSINLSNNNITAGFVDQIILDLGKNYDSVPRSGVLVNLLGNSAPSTNLAVQDTIKKLQINGWRIQTN